MNVYPTPHTAWGGEHGYEFGDGTLQGEATPHQYATRNNRPSPAVSVGKHTGRNLEQEDRNLECRPQQHKPQWVEMHYLDPVDSRHGGPQREEKRERSPDTQVDRIRSKIVHETTAAYRNMSLSGGMRSSLALPEAGEYEYPRTMARGMPSVLPITSSAAAASSSATASMLASMG